MTIKKQKSSLEKPDAWQEIWHSTNIYDTLTPLYRACKILGLAPYSFKDTDGKRKYVTSKLEISYSILFIISYIAFFWYASDGYDRMKFVTSYQYSKVANFIDTFQWYATILVMVGLVIINCFNQNILIEALEKMVSTDEQIEKFGLKIYHYKVKKHIAANVVWLVIVYIIMESLNCSLFLREMKITNSFCYILCYIPLLIGGFVKSQFIVLILLLKSRFKVINNKLFTLTNKPQSSTYQQKIHPGVQVVQEISVQAIGVIATSRKIHSQLCHIGRLINEAFSLQILCIIGYNFVSFTAHAYFCIESYIKIYIEKESIDFELVTTTMWAIVKLIILFHLTYTCNQTKNEAFETAIIIYQIRNRFKDEILDEIIMFGKQILHWDFKFTAFDLFDIDMGAFYLLLTSSATYLVILIQMDLTVNQNFSFKFSNKTIKLLQ